MGKTKYDEAQTELIRAIEEDAPCTFDDPIPVAVTLDNGVRYEGLAYEVQPTSIRLCNACPMSCDAW